MGVWREDLDFFMVVIFLFLVSAEGVLSPKGINFEVQALMNIKACLKDPHNVLDNWDGDSVDPCGWTMVTCSSDNLVIGLGAPSQNLSGTLSPSIGNLTNLQILLLQNNNITGSVPSELGKLSKLQTLDLSNNVFFGEIPSRLSRLRSLHYMRLNNNSFSGVFPSSLSDMTQLDLLDLSYNNLSGPVPRILAKTFNILGNPFLCSSGATSDCYQTQLMPMSMNLNGSQVKTRMTSRRAHTVAIAVGSSLACLLMIFLTISVFWGKTRRQDQEHRFFDIGGEESSLGNLRRFHFRELQNATDNFNGKRLLGRGGFGNVYKGILRDGTIVAVKRLIDGSAKGGEIQFQTEIEMISLAVHRNLLKLHGFCITPAEKLLVYPFMPNGSVASRLKVKPTLAWETRKRIAVGAARGLLYLHEQCDPKIIHRDVKAANILLDEYCEAVVGDFGLAKLLDHQDSHVTTAVRGTVGHIAPEYLSTGQSSEKTDVYGFGILILELVSGSSKAANQKGSVLDWVRKVHQEKTLEVVVDKDLGEDYDRMEVEEMVGVALLCTQYHPGMRPRMSEVVRMLEGEGVVERSWESASLKMNSAEEVISSSDRLASCKFSESERFSSDVIVMPMDDDSSLLIQPMELSGPR